MQPAIRSLVNLRGLFVNSTISFERPLPEEIGELHNLRTLQLSTEFKEADSGTINALPQSLGCLTKLRELHAYNNSLKTVPDSIRLLTHLEKICIIANPLECLPDCLMALAKLQRFDADLCAYPQNTIITFELVDFLSQLKHSYLVPTADTQSQSSAFKKVVTLRRFLLQNCNQLEKLDKTIFLQLSLLVKEQALDWLKENLQQPALVKDSLLDIVVQCAKNRDLVVESLRLAQQHTITAADLNVLFEGSELQELLEKLVAKIDIVQRFAELVENNKSAGEKFMLLAVMNDFVTSGHIQDASILSKLVMILVVQKEWNFVTSALISMLDIAARAGNEAARPILIKLVNDLVCSLSADDAPPRHLFAPVYEKLAKLKL